MTAPARKKPKQPHEALVGEAARKGIKLHRMHANPQATRLQLDDLGMVWRGENGDASLKVDIAHRFAVCWNVLEGCSTELLERGVIRDICDAVEAGDLDGAKKILASFDRAIDRTSGRPHDCKSCIEREEGAVE